MDGTGRRVVSVGCHLASDPPRWSSDGVAAVPPKGCGDERRVGARDVPRSTIPRVPSSKSECEQEMLGHNGKSPEVVAEVLAVHVAEDGWCRGCRDQWQRLVPFTCTQAEWATHALEAGAEPKADQ
jgi:hypothetical protein